MSYACNARTEFGGRCREDARPGDKDLFCALHARLRDSSKPVAKIGLADLVLFKLKIAPEWNPQKWPWLEKFVGAGVARVAQERTQEQKDAGIQAHAAKFGRNANVYGVGRKDSGTAVFGKQGISNILLDTAFAELQKVYGSPAIQLVEGRNSSLVLQMAFSKNGNAVKASQAVINCVAEYLQLGSFGYLMVFANPPDEEKGVVDTINADKRQPREQAKFQLRHADGKWESNPVQA